ncbi:MULTISPECIES: Hsp20/alpha crystallin family protein [unclassified Hyphomicrobium]|uniref:Hsp20/alpha crystallin family protein n=1 Tax=unclassified Hyphomicrobium TaxID=2619925 RepID=UPI000213D611|nr:MULTISPECIES: Hsp20/alpha crystallin family protein [unclassified Hyphomicrobium]CCB66277.1 Heat shock protein, family [Hyphomicrobium sp. MC1]
MAEPAVKLPVKSQRESTSGREWWPLENIRHQFEDLIEEFDRGFLRSPFRGSRLGIEPLLRRELSLVSTPPVDIVDKDTAYEITAELPGLDENNIDVKVANGMLTIKGEKKEEKEEKKKDYFLSERRYGSFERRFSIPEGVDTGKIEANFKKGVLTVALPKTSEAKTAEKKIAVKAA